MRQTKRKQSEIVGRFFIYKAKDARGQTLLCRAGT